MAAAATSGQGTTGETDKAYGRRDQPAQFSGRTGLAHLGHDDHRRRHHDEERHLAAVRWACGLGRGPAGVPFPVKPQTVWGSGPVRSYSRGLVPGLPPGAPVPARRPRIGGGDIR